MRACGRGDDGGQRCPTSWPIRAQGTPRKCSSKMRPWRRSWGEAGTPAVVQARATIVRSRSAVTWSKTR